MKTIPYRIRPRHYFDGRVAVQKFVIEMRCDGKWLSLADQGGEFRFNTRAEAESHLAQPVQISSSIPTK